VSEEDDEENAVPCTEGEDGAAVAAAVAVAAVPPALNLMTAMSRLPAMNAPGLWADDGSHHAGSMGGGGGGHSQRGGRVPRL
jgi:hypothetical protein